MKERVDVVPRGRRPAKQWYSVSVENYPRRAGGCCWAFWPPWGSPCSVTTSGKAGARAGRRRGPGGRSGAHREAQERGARQELQHRIQRRGQELRGGAALYTAESYGPSIEKAKWSYNVLQSILDALALPGASGQAQFIDVQGEVEFRRGDSGDWQEARSRASLRSGDYVRTSDNGSAEIMFLDQDAYTVRANTQFVVAPPTSASGGPAEQAIEMEYGWVNLETAKRSSNVKTPGAVARVRAGFGSVRGGRQELQPGAVRRAYRGGMELASKGGLTREVGELQEVVQTGDLLCADPSACRGSRTPVEPSGRTTWLSTSTGRAGWCSPGSRWPAPAATPSRSPGTTSSWTT